MRRAYIDLGHGENGDPGAVSGNLVEHEMNIISGNACAERLAQYGWEVQVEQGDLEINASARAANAFGADICLSWHENAGGGNRGEVIHAWTDGSLELAQVIAKGLQKAGQTKVNVVKCKANSSGTAPYFGMLRIPKMPAAIVEPCFIDNAEDRTIADTIDEQKNIGYCVADALIEAYGGIFVDGNVVEIWAGGKQFSGQLIDGKTWIPLRGILEALGHKVDVTKWEEDCKVVEIT